MFRGLLANLDKRNPVVYKLPNSIKNRFVGVYANESGEYRDLDVKVYKRYVFAVFGLISHFFSIFFYLLLSVLTRYLAREAGFWKIRISSNSQTNRVIPFSATNARGLLWAVSPWLDVTTAR